MPLQHKRAHIPIRLHEHRLKRMHTNAKILALPQQIPILLTRPRLLVLLVPMVSAHHRIDLVPCGEDEAGGRDFGRDGGVPVVEAAVDAGRLVHACCFWGRGWEGWVVGGGGGSAGHVGVFACWGELDGVGGEVVEGFLGWEEERFDADDVGGPDHGLDVEGWPAVCGDADKLGVFLLATRSFFV